MKLLCMASTMTIRELVFSAGLSNCSQRSNWLSFDKMCQKTQVLKSKKLPICAPLRTLTQPWIDVKCVLLSLWIFFVITGLLTTLLFSFSIACYKKNLNYLLYNLGRDNLVERFKVGNVWKWTGGWIMYIYSSLLL